MEKSIRIECGMTAKNDVQRNVKAEESFDEHCNSSNQKNVEKYYCLGFFLFFLFHFKSRNGGGWRRDFCFTAENLASAHKLGGTNTSWLERELYVRRTLFRRNYCGQWS